MLVYGTLLILAALTMIGGLVAAWVSWSLVPFWCGLGGAIVVGLLASAAPSGGCCAPEHDGREAGGQ